MGDAGTGPDLYDTSGIFEVDFARDKARELLMNTYGDPNLRARRNRIQEELRFEDVVDAVYDRHGRTVFSCPFHGRDSHPSFTLYRRTNDGHCYGCPEGEKNYDAVRFVAKIFGYTTFQAATYIEKEFDLPPLEVTQGEEEEGDEAVDAAAGTITLSLNFNHLAGPYIRKASEDFRRTLDTDLAREYLTIFFESQPRPKEDANSPEVIERAVPLARVLGSDAIEAIKKRELR